MTRFQEFSPDNYYYKCSSCSLKIICDLKRGIEIHSAHNLTCSLCSEKTCESSCIPCEDCENKYCSKKCFSMHKWICHVCGKSKCFNMNDPELDDICSWNCKWYREVFNKKQQRRKSVW